MFLFGVAALAALILALKAVFDARRVRVQIEHLTEGFAMQTTAWRAWRSS